MGKAKLTKQATPRLHSITWKRDMLSPSEIWAREMLQDWLYRQGATIYVQEWLKETYAQDWRVHWP